MKPSLKEIHRSHQGKISDRWESYLEIYARLFSSKRNDSIHLLEIGIQNGGSLEIWAEYFSHARLLLGCDINPLCGNLVYEDNRIAIVVADACNEDAFQQVISYSSCFDFIIDDGSHHSGDIIVAFSKYFPLISEDGLFIAEDLHCSYWQEFEGGLTYPLSTIAFFKKLIDLVNHEHWGVSISRSAYVAEFNSHFGCTFDEDLLAQISSIEFVNSMCVVRKRIATANLLGPRAIVGTSEEVSTDSLGYGGTFSQPLDQSGNIWSDPRCLIVPTNDDGHDLYIVLTEKCARVQARIDELHEVLAKREDDLVLFTAERDENSQAKQDEMNEVRAQYATLVDQCKSYESHINDLQRGIAGRDEAISRIAADRAHDLLTKQSQVDEYRSYTASLTHTIHARDEQLKELLAIQYSHATRFAQLLESSSRKFFPTHSKRRRVLAGGLRFAYRVYRYGLRPALKLTFAVGVPPDLEPATEGQPVEADACAQPPEYAKWIQINEPSFTDLELQRKVSASYRVDSPLFSVILPVYKVSSGVLTATLASLAAQSWQNWEACVVYADTDDDSNFSLLERFAANEPRIRLSKLNHNGGISSNSNAALTMARGEFITLLDHDDELTPWALYDMAQKIAAIPDVDFLYSDKDSINASGSLRQSPLFKPRWSPEMLYSVNYLTHLNVMRRAVIQHVGGWRTETDGAQDWDLFLRVTEASRRIERVESIGYHWRIIEGSTSTGIAAKPYAALGQLRTLEARISRLGLSAFVMPDPDSGFRLVWSSASTPCIDVILYSSSDTAGLEKMLAWLVSENDGIIASISIVHDIQLLKPDFIQMRAGVQIRQFIFNDECSMTLAMHSAAQSGQGTVLLLIDLAVFRVARGSLRELAGWAWQHQEIAFVGALLLTSGDTVVESGRIIDNEFNTLPLFRGTPLRHWGPLGGPLWFRNVSAVAPTVVAFKRRAWHLERSIHLEWPKAFASCCVDATADGLRGMVTPHARAYLDRMPTEPLVQWNSSFSSDPYFHPAFSSAVPLTISTMPQ